MNKKMLMIALLAFVAQASVLADHYVNNGDNCCPPRARRVRNCRPRRVRDCICNQRCRTKRRSCPRRRECRPRGRCCNGHNGNNGSYRVVNGGNSATTAAPVTEVVEALDVPSPLGESEVTA